MGDLATGNFTFLFTDIEGSTKLWERHPTAMRAALARHDAILRIAIEGNRGHVFKTVGDAFYAVFGEPLDAVGAAVRMQYDLQAEEWGEVSQIRVRTAINSGEAEQRGNDYFGPPLNRVARLLSAGHGGQVLLSSATAELVRDLIPESLDLRDMGERRLKDLPRPERVCQLVAPGLPASFPPLKTLDDRPNNLPAQLTSLVGREREVEGIRQRLQYAHTRLVTLTGPGGIGKTRLGLQVAANMLDDFADGVFFVNLSSITDSRLVGPTIAQTLGLRDSGGRPLVDILKDHLREKQLLLMLDNFEQVIAAASLVGELLEVAPRLKLLVTSRRLLRLYGEQHFPVPPLALPDRRRAPSVDRIVQFESVRLFVDRAKSLKPEFEATAQNASAIAEICRRLDGLPLAIELAAARIRILNPQAMLAKLESSLKMATGGASNLPARQQKLRSTIEWSYNLLDRAEQELFQRLSIFVGGCTLEAAEDICDGSGDLDLEVLDGIESLVDKSLLRQEEETDDGARFAMLETIREYGLECLQRSGEVEVRRRRHADFFLSLAEKSEPELTGAQQAVWLNRLGADQDNLRSAMGWTLDSGLSEVALRMSAALHRYWAIKGPLSEGRSWFEKTLAKHQGEPSLVRARALRGAGNIAWRQADFAAAERFHQGSLAIYRELGDRWGVAAALNNLSIVAGYRGDHPRARSFLEESLAIYRELGDKTNIAVTLTNLGWVAENREDFDLASSLYKESLAIGQELGDRARVALNLYNLGVLATCRGDYPVARAYCEESLAIYRELGDNRTSALALGQLGGIALQQGDLSLAQTYLRESLTTQREVGDKRGIIQALNRYACLSAAQGQPERAARLLGATEANRQAVGVGLPPAERNVRDSTASLASAALGEDRYAAELAGGESLSLEEAAAYALGEHP